MIWKLEDAKNRFSELVRRARSEGPQHVTKHGKEAVVVIAADEYQALAGATDSLVLFLGRSPFGEAVRDGELDLTRAPEYSRDVEL